MRGIISHCTVIVCNLFSKKKVDSSPTQQETAEQEKGGKNSLGINAKDINSPISGYRLKKYREYPVWFYFVRLCLVGLSALTCLCLAAVVLYRA